MEHYFSPVMDRKDVNQISALGLAHCGDAVYELLVRTWLCTHGGVKVKSLHRETIRYVAATAQAALMDRLLPLLTEEETDLYRRGRNANVHTIPKSASREQYAKATGLECLFGGLYLLGRRERVEELFCAIMEDDHAL